MGALTPPIVEEIAKVQPTWTLCLKILTRSFMVEGPSLKNQAMFSHPKSSLFSNNNGSTETGSYPQLRQEGEWAPEGWTYIMPHPAAGLEFRHRFDKGLRSTHCPQSQRSTKSKPVFKLHPRPREFRVGDLFPPIHPSNPNMWEPMM